MTHKKTHSYRLVCDIFSNDFECFFFSNRRSTRCERSKQLDYESDELRKIMNFHINLAKELKRKTNIEFGQLLYLF